jgi:hypothetical protein
MKFIKVHTLTEYGHKVDGAVKPKFRDETTFIQVRCIKALTRSNEGYTLIYLGENHPTRVKETVEEIMAQLN